jgi:hypothetical protein
MRQGFRVIDADTHVNPSMDVLLRYADKALQERLDELQPYMRRVKPRPGRGCRRSGGVYYPGHQAVALPAGGRRKIWGSHGAWGRSWIFVWTYAHGDAPAYCRARCRR